MSTTSFEDFIQRYTQLQAYESSKDKLLQVCMRARTADIMIPFARPGVAEHLTADNIYKKEKPNGRQFERPAAGFPCCQKSATIGNQVGVRRIVL